MKIKITEKEYLKKLARFHEEINIDGYHGYAELHFVNGKCNNIKMNQNHRIKDILNDNFSGLSKRI